MLTQLIFMAFWNIGEHALKCTHQDCAAIEISAAWRNGLMGTSWNSIKRTSKLYICSGITLCTLTCWELTSWRAAQQKRPLGYRWIPSCWAISVPLQQKKTMVSYAVDRALPEGWTQKDHHPAPVLGAGETHLGSLSKSGLPSTRETRSYWRHSNKGPQKWLRYWSISPIKKGWESWDCLAWRSVRYIIHVWYQHAQIPIEGCQ